MAYQPVQIDPLPKTPSRDLVLKHLEHFKVQALNYSLGVITDYNAKHLEPREVKTLVDLVLNLEDSVRSSAPEGQQARAVHRLLDKYSS